MKLFRINQKVIVPKGREGTIKAISGNQILVWFDDAGNDVGYYNATTLNYSS